MKITNNLTWHKRLYIGKNLKKVKKVIANVKRSKFQLNVYVIVKSARNGNIEIYPSYILIQDYYKKEKMLIIGLASDKEEAMNLIADMVNDCYRKYNHYNPAAMFN